MTRTPGAGEAMPATMIDHEPDADLWAIENCHHTAVCSARIAAHLVDHNFGKSHADVTGSDTLFYLPRQNIEDLSFVVNAALDNVGALKTEIDILVAEVTRLRDASTAETVQ